MMDKIQRFSIRKLSVGAASVLIGVGFIGMSNSIKVEAATQNGQPEIEQVKVNTDAQQGVSSNTTTNNQVVAQTPTNKQNMGGRTLV